MCKAQNSLLVSRSWEQYVEAGVSLAMWNRWRWVLPLIGLTLFGVESYHSYRLNEQLGANPRRYYWWSGIRLDSRPTRTTRESSPSCQPETKDCTFQLDFVWVDPGYATQLLTYSALPAFAAEWVILVVAERFGVGQVWTFMLTMPVLIAGWFCLVGWLIDLWILRRSLPRSSTA